MNKLRRRKLNYHKRKKNIELKNNKIYVIIKLKYNKNTF